jgi:carbon-monoxide dehydrogenase small subunit
MAKEMLRITVNGRYYERETDPRITLAEFVRNELGLTGTKESCNAGVCGACTVLLNGKAVKSCLILAIQAMDKEVLTIEGLRSGKDLHPLQKAFLEEGAVQCGFCAPGMILSAKALLDENPEPSEEEVRYALVGNFCRCGGYVKIINAVLRCAEERRKEIGA